MLTQENRSLKLRILDFGTNALLPIEATVTEAISQSFLVQIHCMSQQAVDCKKLLGQAATLILTANRSKPRYVNGVISKISCNHKNSANLRRYQLNLIPAFETLKKFYNSQFFTDLSMPDIFMAYCKTLGFTGYDLSGLTKNYPVLPYKAQINETAFDFLSRILEEAGINYYFRQTETAHTLMLTDAAWPAIGSLKKEHLFTWQEQLSRIPFSQQQQKMQEGTSDYSNFSAGHIFKIKDPFLIMAITHRALDYTYVPEEALSLRAKRSNPVAALTELTPSGLLRFARNDDVLNFYENQFSCMNTAKNFTVPVPRKKKPIIANLQTATVAAPTGIIQDIYTNALGQVRLHFPWDQQKKLSNWVQVSQAASGSAFGCQFIPRIGQEVLVSYFGGDCDQPVVINAVPNARNKPAYDLEANPNCSWIKTNTLNSTLNSKSSEQANQIILDDTEAQEKFHLIAEKNYLEEVKHNAEYKIEGNDTLHIHGDALMQALNGMIYLKGKTLRLNGGGSEMLIDANGVHLSGAASASGRVNFLSRGAGTIKPIARVGDPHQCPKQTDNIAHHGGPILTGANPITANGKAIARVGDVAHCRVGKDSVKQGISSMLVNGKPVARLNHTLAHGGVITGASPNVYVGEKPEVPDVYQLLHIKPKHILVIHVCDFHNVTDPTNKLAVMQQAIQGMSARPIALLQDGSERPWPLTSVINGKLYLPGQKPNDIKKLTVKLNPGSVCKNQQVNIIAINNQPVPATDVISLTSSDFTQMANYQDQGKNTCYPMTITVLQPAIFFNFRQDNWLNDLTDAEKKAYTSVSNYYAAPQAWADQIDRLTIDEINYFKFNGNNATIYIHGFNVPTGNFAKGFTFADEINLFSNKLVLVPSEHDATLYRDQTSLSPNLRQAFLNYAPSVAGQIMSLVGTGAHRWLICMEKNLNEAAGMLSNDYRKFTRLIFINWQGNPVKSFDYMAAPCLINFPARKILGIIQQLQQAGIKINIMAHSLGCAVLMQVLELCATANIALSHAFLWEAAIPDTAFKTDLHWYFPMLNKQQPEQLNSILPYSYNYPHAHQGAAKFTVLYSKEDNILGPMQDDVAPVILTNASASHMGMNLLAKAVIDNLFLLGVTADTRIKPWLIKKTCDWMGLTKPFPGPVATAEKFTLHNYQHLALLTAKIYDPAAGLSYAVIADMIDILDHYFVPLAKMHKKLLSIYHLANMFAMPFSYFLYGEKNCEDFFQMWRKSYPYYQLTLNGTTTNQPFAENLTDEIKILKRAYPKVYEFIYECAADIRQLKEGHVPSWLSREEQNAADQSADAAPCVGVPLQGKLVKYLLDKIEKHGNNSLHEILEKYLNNVLADFLLVYPDYLISTILIGLLTPEAVPKEAMGWNGINPNSVLNEGKEYKSINQKNLLPDHSGMLFPNAELFQQVYEKQLMRGKKGEQFDYFGLYKPA